eukprot:scaffold304987_cov18-Tisochrysis_lutea.AAC.1
MRFVDQKNGLGRLSKLRGRAGYVVSCRLASSQDVECGAERGRCVSLITESAESVECFSCGYSAKRACGSFLPNIKSPRRGLYGMD